MKTLILLFSVLFTTMSYAQVPANGLVGWWPFNGNANDESGNGNNGTVNGATLTTDRNGNINSAYSFDGINDYIIGLSNSFPTNQRTVSVWFFSNNIGIGNLGRGVLGYGGNTCGQSWNMHLDNAGSPLGLDSYEVNSHCNVFSVTSSYGSLIPNGNWHNWVVSTNPNGTYFYLDGNLIQSSNQFINNTVVTNKNFVFGTFTNPNGIGASINDPNNTVWNGTLDDIGIWNRALTQQEITNLYTSTVPVSCLPAYVPTSGLVGYWPFCGNANDESGNGNNGTVNGATMTTDRNGVANQAYSFDPNSNSNINIPFSSSLNTIQNGITISAWIYMDGGTPAGTPPRILELRGAYGGGGDAGFVMLATDNNNSSRVFELKWYNNNDNSNLHFSPTNSTLTSLNWHLISFTADGIIGVAKYYFDGVLQSTSSNDIITQCNYNNNPLILGAEPNLLGKWGGKLDDIGIWNRALTQQEITNLYTSTVPVSCLPAYVPTSGLVGYWPFCGNANDESGNGNNGTVNGATLTTDRNGNVNSAYSFDGLNDYINVINPTILNFNIGISFTVSFFYNAGNIVTNSSGFNGIIARQSNNNGPINGWQIGRDINNYRLEGPQIGIDGCGTNTLSSVDFNQWVNIVQVYDRVNGIVTTYKNSSMVNQIYCTPILSSMSNNYDLKFGVERENNHYSSGKLDDIGIWNRVLTDCEIQNLYTSQLNSTFVSAGADQTICDGQQVTLSASNSQNYSWNNGVIDNISFSPTSTQDYIVTADSANCQSSDTVTIFVNESTSSTQFETSCDSYTWNGQTYTASGVYIGTTTNCVTESLNLTINPSTSSSISQTALDSYTWPVNNQTYTTTGAYTAVIPNAAGCDSTITLNLTMSFTGITDLSASKLSIYPNPTNGDFTITGLELVGTVSSLSLTDMNGKVVKVLDTKATKFSMASIKPGVYFLNIISGNRQEVLKIVKE